MSFASSPAAPQPSTPTPQFFPDHQDYLTARAVPLLVAAAAGLRSVTGDEAQALLGRKATIPSDGIAIPYPGIVPPYHRIRFTDAEAVGSRYLAPAGREVPVYVPPATTRQVQPIPASLQTPLVVVESSVKALALMGAGIDAVGLGGTGTTLAEKNGTRRVNSSWSAVPLAGRDVIVCFDAGRATNPNVARDEARLTQALRAAGAASVSVASLPLLPGDEDQGPDDFIAAQGPAAIYAVLHAAVPAGPLDRVAAHIAAGRAAADLLDDVPFLHSIIEASASTRLKARDALVSAKLGKRDVGNAIKKAEEDALRAAVGDGSKLGDDLGVADGRICRMPGSVTEVPLCNFDARILEERVIDDGNEQRRTLLIGGTLEDGTPLPPVSLEPSDLADSIWPFDAWGSKAVVAARKGVIEEIRLAMQLRSRPRVHTVYSHTGWRFRTDSTGAEGGLPVFLNANGAIGATDVTVELADRLGSYALPSEPVDVAEAVRSSLKLLELGPIQVMYTLLAMTYRAPLQALLAADFAAFVFGKTGSLKTAVAKVATAHFGVGLADAPATSFEASASSIEMVLNRAKDVLVLVDDFKPASTLARDDHQMKARYAFSSIGNQEGRGRMHSDGSVRRARPPRALVIATGEALPTGESTIARLLPVPLLKDKVDLKRLAAAQANVEALPHAMAAYLHYLRPRLGDLARTLKARHSELRARFSKVAEGAHLRSPSALAHVALGLEMLWPFAVHVGAITPTRAKEHEQEALRQLESLGIDAKGHARETDPVRRFLDHLREKIAQGSLLVHHNLAEPLANRRGESSLIGEWIGWHDDENYYFLGEPTYGAVARSMGQGEPMPFGASTLWRHLREQGLILPGDRHGRHTRRVQLGGQRTDVVVMKKTVLQPEDDGPGGPGGTGGPTDGGSVVPAAHSDAPDYSAGEERNRTTGTENRTNSGLNRTSGAAGSAGSGEAQPAAIAAPSPTDSHSAGPVGTVGTVEREEKRREDSDSSKLETNESIRGLSSIPPGTGPTGPTAQPATPCGDDAGSSPTVGSDSKTEPDQLHQREPRSVVADGLAVLRKMPLGSGRPFFCLKTAKRLLGEGAVAPDDYTRQAELAQRLASAGLGDVAKLEFDLLPVVAAMEKAGVGVDVTAWAELVARAEDDVARRAAELAAHGLANPADDSQVRTTLRGRGVDQPSTSWKALAPYMADPFVAALVGYRRTAGFLNSVGRAVLGSARRGGGRVHATFDPLAAPTGRMSCSKPNLLAIPKASEYRRCITPAPAHLLVVADYAAIELRVLAALTGDKALTRVFTEGGDPHAATAAALLGKSVGEVSREERQRAKAVNFGFAFGMGPAKFVEYAFGNFGLTVSLDDARAMRMAFLDAYPGVALWQRQARNEMPLEVRTRLGRRRIFKAATAEYCERLNTPVQGTAADGLKLAMVLLHDRLRGTGARVVLAIHDELVVEVLAPCAEEARARVVDAMMEGMSTFVNTTPVKVESAVRRTWAE